MDEGGGEPSSGLLSLRCQPGEGQMPARHVRLKCMRQSWAVFPPSLSKDSGFFFCDITSQSSEREPLAGSGAGGGVLCCRETGPGSHFQSAVP